MSGFRDTLAAYAVGQADFETLQRVLTTSLASEPQQASGYRAAVDALFRAGRISPDAQRALVQVIEAATPPPQTILRAPKENAEPPAANEVEPTRFRASPANPGLPPAMQPDAQLTRLRARQPDSDSGREPSVRPEGPARSDTGGGSSNWTDPTQWARSTAPLTVGSVLKERFILEEEIGRGGMGIVFKSRDLRMEEAQDRNPYVALKILNDEFKRHPESLKALQREFRKSQSLAHPNVVTVGDFDRDGSNVFMTMELLDGEPLDRLIKQAGNAGLGKERALRITRDICRAMAYAHERGIVHSDFKPANAFLTRAGVVKVFDFGIARAAKQNDKATGSVTVFDAGTLGGLTPAYASCEMIEGLEPDVRDDVYAIACVTYELLTGRHPFGRKSAVQARDAQLRPQRPGSLSRGQWRALRRGLAFKREQRSASAIELLNGLLPPKRSAALYGGIGVALVAAVVVAIVVVPGQLQRYQRQRWLTALRSGNGTRIAALLPAIDRLSRTGRDAIFADRGARDGLIHFYQRRIRNAELQGNYFSAGALARQLLKYLPDYADAQRIAQQVASDASNALERESNLFDADLTAGRLIPAQGKDNVEAVLAAVRRIDPHSALLHDPRLPGAFATQVRLALAHADTGLAAQLLTSALSSTPSNPMLLNLDERVRSTVQAQRTSTEIADSEQSLSALLKKQPPLKGLLALQQDVMTLRVNAPQDPVLSAVHRYGEQQLAHRLERLEKHQDYDDARALLKRYATLASAAFVERERDRLATARVRGPNQAAQVARIRAARSAELQSDIATLLKDGPGLTPALWDMKLRARQSELGVYLAASDPFFTRTRAQAAADYLAQSNQLRRTGQLHAAGQMLARAQTYGLPPSQYARALKSLTAARERLAAQEVTQQQQAQTEAIEQKLRLQAAANNVVEALASLRVLQGRLAPQSSFLTVDAPAAIGAAYLRLAGGAALDGRFAEALRLVAKGRATVPTFAPLAAAAQRYGGYVSLERAMRSVDQEDLARIRAQITQAAQQSPVEARALERALEHDFAARLAATANPAAAAHLMAIGHSLFPNDKTFARPTPPPPSALAQSRSPATPAAHSAPTAPEPVSPAAPAQAARAVSMARSTSAVSHPALAGPPSLHSCANPELIGAGANPRASCWDRIAGARGPILVVVPAPPGGHPFAIGRYTVSNAEFARYCAATGKCAPSAASPSLPVTSISIAQARQYLHWLSRETGAIYRLPTAAQYVYAADAGAQGAPIENANCRKPGVAASLLPVNSGSPNAWGLYNPYGNVQQWVRHGSQLQARGGDYRDSFSECTPAAARAQSGAPSAVTGFRVVRQIQ